MVSHSHWSSIFSSILLPEAVLAEPDEEEEDTTDEGGDSKTHEGASKVVLDGGDAGLGGDALSDGLDPVEQSLVADTSALVLVLEELDPLLDVSEVSLLSEVLGELVESVVGGVTSLQVLDLLWILNILDALVVAIVGDDVIVCSENEGLGSLVSGEFGDGKRGPLA